MLRRYVLAGVIAVTVLIVGILAYGYYDLKIRQPAQPAITVNGSVISEREFTARVVLVQAQQLGRLRNLTQLQALFGDNPDVQAQLQSQIDQLQTQIANPAVLGQQVIDQMIRELLIRQEAERRGIGVNESEVDRLIQEGFGYYAEGTPTPVPTSTPDPTALAAAPPTSTPTAGPSPTPTSPSPTPIASPTPYTRELFEQDFEEYIDSFEEQGVRESDYRNFVRADIFRRQLQEAFVEAQGSAEEQVRARHILVEEEVTAQELLDRLAEGEPWEELAAEYSLDQSNRERGGDLGWFGRGQMVDEFEEAAFEGEVGQVVGPVETSFGYHLIEIQGHEERELSPSEREQAGQRAFNEWLTEARGEADVDIAPTWPDLVPTVQVQGAGTGF